MGKRKTVAINYKKTIVAIKEEYRNNTIFCEKYNSIMRTNRTTKWVSEWKRGRNLPSPEEAAQMCLLLHTTPEEILLTEGETEKETAQYQEDIALVHELMEEMQGGKEAPAAEGEGAKETISNFIDTTTDRAALLEIISKASKKLQELE